MHARELVELAAIVSQHGPVLLRESRPFRKEDIDGYWSASKSRMDRWGRTLKVLGEGPASSRPTSPSVRGTLEEILTGEILTRVWTALLSLYDRVKNEDALEPIGRSVLLGHLEARHRVLTLLVRGPGICAEEAVRFNRLRRRSERWADMLVGYLAVQCDVTEFAVDPERAGQFAEDFQRRSRLSGGRMVGSLVRASLRAAFSDGLIEVSPNADLNYRIAETVFSCFPSDLFDGTGLIRSLWQSRLLATADDAQCMVEDLVAALETPCSTRHSPPGAVTGRRFGAS